MVDALDAQLSAGDAGKCHEGADLDVIGPTSWVQPAELVLAVDDEHVRADAVDLRAHRDEHAREVLHVRLTRALPMVEMRA